MYYREILTRLATETNLATEILDRKRRAKPRMLVDFSRSPGKERVPGGSDTRARLMAREQQREGRYLRKLYETRFHRKNPFRVVYDCSAFPLAQIARQIVHALELKGRIPKR